MAEPSRQLGFVTYSGAPDLTEDDRLVIEPLRRIGYAVRPLVWDAGAVERERYEGLILRSTWDYHKKPRDFSTWLAQVESRHIPLWNPPALIRWNMDKSYLKDLASKGVPVTPTEWLARGATTELAGVLQRNGWERAVVKPTLSATAYETWIVTLASARQDQLRLETLTSRGGVLVQRFEESIVSGEWSLVFFRGEFSHAVLKVPTEGDFRVQKEYGGTSVPADAPDRVVAIAERVLREVEFPGLYARVDLVDSDTGVRLMELEMLEPDLFLRHNAEAPERFAEAIKHVLKAVAL